MLKDSCDSLGTRSLPESNRSTSPDCDAENDTWLEDESQSRVLDRETLPVTFSDVSFFRKSDAEDNDSHAFQRTLAIVKPEVARFMYKIESVMARNGFIIITVCAFIVITIVNFTPLALQKADYMNQNDTQLAIK